MEGTRIRGRRGALAGLVAVGAACLLTGCGSSTTTTTTTVVAQAVTVQVTSPVSGMVMNANSVAVRGTVTPANATVQIDGHPAAVGNGVFTGSVGLAGGKNTIDIIGSATGQSPGATELTVTRQVAVAKKAPKVKKVEVAAKSSSSASTANVADEQPAANVANEQPASDETPCPQAEGLEVGGSHTTCDFAANVEEQYDSDGPGTYDVYSPVTGGTYTMTCDDTGDQVVCTGGINNAAAVYFPG